MSIIMIIIIVSLEFSSDKKAFCLPHYTTYQQTGVKANSAANADSAKIRGPSLLWAVIDGQDLRKTASL